MGEVRKGKKLALVGFPVANKEELARVAAQEGVDFIFLPYRSRTLELG